MAKLYGNILTPQVIRTRRFDRMFIVLGDNTLEPKYLFYFPYGWLVDTAGH